MIQTVTVLRLCFVVLFGAMSLLHGPVMTFSRAHTAAAGQQQNGYSHHAASDRHDERAPAAGHVECNAFACFMAVEPPHVTARPLHPILFAIMAAEPVPALDPIYVAPALPPPRR